ncbi:MAG: T9SS type A sorting domain-containing protein [Bacteroidales bacterium]|nr:T9SS type A sorting domain-containing protein [Bacteroidales bacterium]
MKSLYLFAFVLLFFGITKKTTACPFMGGEISWVCLSNADTNNGKFIFTMKLYRTCGGSQFPSSQTIFSNSPAGYIYLLEELGWPKEISPICNSNASFQHITCQGAAVNSITGAIQEHIYKSQPIKISGYPPVNGWRFYWSGCCRNPATNAIGGGSQSYRVKATMFPYISQNGSGLPSMYPCFDSSPTFAEKPVTAIATGYVYDFNFMAYDEDYDSLTYDWGQPLLSTGNPISYYTGYSHTNPLPDTMQNANNITATLDLQTGIIEFKSYTTGSFLTAVKVTSYRCGQKIAEVQREIQVVLSDSSSNTPPVIAAPFANGTSFDTVVTAGALLQFYYSVTDYQFLPNSAPQTIYITQTSPQFGSFIPAVGTGPTSLNATTGCNNPPCATLSPASDTSYTNSSVFGSISDFSWQTTCDHLLRNDSCAIQMDTVYYKFILTVRDDYCPVPAVTTKIVTVGVTADLSFLPAPIIDSVFFDYSTNEVVINWQSVSDPKNKFEAYYIYYSSSYNGSFALIDSVTSLSTTSYNHYLGQATSAYYKVRTKSVNHCQIVDISDDSNIFSLDITAMENANIKDRFVLYSNKPNPANHNTTIRFYTKESSNIELVLSDISGGIIKQKEFRSVQGDNSYMLSIESLSVGVYYITLYYKDQQRSNKLMIK